VSSGHGALPYPQLEASSWLALAISALPLAGLVSSFSFNLPRLQKATA
jgi:hypothetical protein